MPRFQGRDTGRLTRATLRLKEPRPEIDPFIFYLNPSSLIRSRLPKYAMVPGAGVDYTVASNYPPFQWTGNGPEEIALEFLMDAPTFGFDKLDVELRLLDKFQEKIGKEPPDLIFSMGKRADVVRIFSHSVREQLYNQDLTIRQATVSMRLSVIIPRI